MNSEQHATHATGSWLRYLLSFVRLLRPHQWTKNLLVFVPVVLAHEFYDITKFLLLAVSFVALSICASGIYIINDCLDIESDRLHPQKKFRPLAAGEIRIPQAIPVAAILVCTGFILSMALLPVKFALVLLLYVLLSGFYSFYFKNRLILDVLVLSALYSIRIFSGGIVASVAVSPWLLAFSSFFFLSLAFVKRYVELKISIEHRISKLNGRDYYTGDMSLVLTTGITSGYMSVLVFFLYITNSSEVIRLYSKPEVLWLIGPVLIYWISRAWFLAQRGQIDCDPILFALKDRISWFAGICIAAIVIIGSKL